MDLTTIIKIELVISLAHRNAGLYRCCTSFVNLGSSDNDPLFTYHRWLANLRILEIDEVKTVPYTPVSHPFVERLIGSIRRELLVQIFFWNTVDLERKLRSFQFYFNHSQTHASLDGDTPAERSDSVVTHLAALRNFTWEKHCGGLSELPVAA